MEMLHIDGQEEEQINLDAYLHDKNDVMEMLHDDDGQEEEERLGCLHDENTYRNAT
jgi:hypothetical protein